MADLKNYNLLRPALLKLQQANPRTDCGMCAISDVPTKLSVVSDHEVEKEKSPNPSGPRIRCPHCGWSPCKDDLWFLHLRT